MGTAIIAGVVVLALAIVLYPLFAKPNTARFASEGEVRQEVDRYRAAIKNKTLCERCLSANPAKSNYCMDCGRPL